jgi:wyosine [tRNA(Phe)-imidazoG37] synthetase (radical SAM superfamily)
LWMDSVAKAANKADILAPSLDAGDGETFDRINRPHPEITYEKLLNGLERVTHSHPGEVHLEVMLVQGINEDPENLIAIKNQLNKLHFDRIDVNTPVRPPIPERGAIPCNESALNRALEILGPKAHAIGTFKQPNEASQTVSHSFSDRDKDIREILLRRPCTINDIAASLGLRHTEVTQSLGRLKTAGLIQSRRGNRETYFHITTPNPTILRSSE